MKNKIKIYINGKEVWNFVMSSQGKLAGNILEDIFDLFPPKLDYWEIRSIFLSNPDYINIEDCR